MNEQERYEPTWRDDAELDALLRAGKVIGLADIDRTLDIKAGYQAIPVEAATELPDSPRLWRTPCTGSPTPSQTPSSSAARLWRCPTRAPRPGGCPTRAPRPGGCPTRAPRPDPGDAPPARRDPGDAPPARRDPGDAPPLIPRNAASLGSCGSGSVIPLPLPHKPVARVTHVRWRLEGERRVVWLPPGKPIHGHGFRSLCGVIDISCFYGPGKRSAKLAQRLRRWLFRSSLLLY